MNRQWLCSKSARDSTDSPASRCGKHGGGGNGQLHLIKHPQCLACTCRGASLKNSAAAQAASLASTVVRPPHGADRLGGCHADPVLAAAEPPPFDRQAWRLVALEWPRWGPRRALRARRSGMHKAELRRKCTPQAASHRLLRCAQQLAVAVGAAAARTTRYRCLAAGRRSVSAS